MTRFFMMLAHCMDLGDARVVFLFVPAGMPHFSQTLRLSKAISHIQLVFQRGPGSSSSISIPAR